MGNLWLWPTVCTHAYEVHIGDRGISRTRTLAPGFERYGDPSQRHKQRSDRRPRPAAVPPPTRWHGDHGGRADERRRRRRRNWRRLHRQAFLDRSRSEDRRDDHRCSPTDRGGDRARSRLAWTHLRPNWFMQNELSRAKAVARDGVFYARGAQALSVHSILRLG